MSLNKVDNDAGQGPSKPMGGLAFDLLIADIVAEAKNRSKLKVFLVGDFFKILYTVDDEWGPEGTENRASISCLNNLLNC